MSAQEDAWSGPLLPAPRSKAAEILRVLMAAEGELTTRQVAEATGDTDHAAVRILLLNLWDRGLIQRSVAFRPGALP